MVLKLTEEITFSACSTSFVGGDRTADNRHRGVDFEGVKIIFVVGSRNNGTCDVFEYLSNANRPPDGYPINISRTEFRHEVAGKPLPADGAGDMKRLEIS